MVEHGLPLVQQAKIPVIGPESTSEEIVNPFPGWVWATECTYPNQADVAVAYAIKKLGTTDFTAVGLGGNVASADAYLNLFNDKTVQVPWGTPCARLEGGLYTSKSAPGQPLAPTDTCNVGVPSGVPIVDRTYVIDVPHGAVAVLSHFGKAQEPDFHVFRIEHGKLKYVHTITACVKVANCGVKVSPQVEAQLGK